MLAKLQIFENEVPDDSNVDKSSDKIIIFCDNDKIEDSCIDQLEIEGYFLVLSQNIGYYGKYLIVYNKVGFNDDISFVIQGKSNKDLLFKSILNYLRFGCIIISVWGTNRLSPHKVNEFIKKNKINPITNLYYQVYSSLAGIQISKTKFTIKVRGDEYYHDLSKFISKMKEDETKIITSNMFFRKSKTFTYHISDHIIGGTSDNLYKMFNTCKKNLDKRYIRNINKNVPEQCLTFSYLLNFYKESELTSKNSKEFMIKHFDIVCLEDFVDFIVSYSGKKVMGVSDLKNHNIVDIHSILEI